MESNEEEIDKLEHELANLPERERQRHWERMDKWRTMSCVPTMIGMNNAIGPSEASSAVERTPVAELIVLALQETNKRGTTKWLWHRMMFRHHRMLMSAWNANDYNKPPVFEMQCGLCVCLLLRWELGIAQQYMVQGVLWKRNSNYSTKHLGQWLQLQAEGSFTVMRREGQFVAGK
jgi:hypothetical protein